MSDQTKIEWTDATANYINGCSVVSPGCTNCYAMRLAGTRMKHHPTREGLTDDSKAGPVWNGTIRPNDAVLAQVLGWKRPRRIFWNAHGDLFHEGVTDEQIDRQFAVMALTPHHIHQVLTKRPDRMREYICSFDFDRMIESCRDGRGASMIVKHSIDTLRGHFRLRPPYSYERDCSQWPLPNVWLGTSVEDQARADERIPALLATPAAVRFLSCEPLLGPVDLTNIGSTDPYDPFDPFDAIGRGWHDAAPKLDWVIVGGESGPNARGSTDQVETWSRALLAQCRAAGTAFFGKQNFKKRPLPDDLQVREFPA